MHILDIPNSRISCKSGQITKSSLLKKNCVRWSGSRTTKIDWKLLDEKISYLSDSHDDWIILLAKNKPFNRKYYLLIIPSDTVKVKRLSWYSKTEKMYEGKGDFVATISKSMSHQLWTTYPLELVPYKYDIII